MPVDVAIKDNYFMIIKAMGEIDASDLHHFEELFNTQESPEFKILVDLREATGINPAVMVEIINKMTGYSQAVDGRLIGCVLLLSEKVTGAIEMLFRLYPPKTPVKITSSMDLACQYLSGELLRQPLAY